MHWANNLFSGTKTLSPLIKEALASTPCRIKTKPYWQNGFANSTMKRVPLGGNLLRPNMVLLMVLLSIAWSSPSTAKGPWKFIIKQQRLVTSRVKFQVKDGEPPSLFCPTIGWQTVRRLHAFLSFLLYQITKLPLLRRFSILIFAFVTSNSKGIYRAIRQWNWLI